MKGITAEDVKYLETQRNAAQGTLGYWEFRVACYWQAPSMEDVKAVAGLLVGGKASNVWHAVSLYLGRVSDCPCCPCRKVRKEVA